MNWVVINTETSSIMAGFKTWDEADVYKKNFNTVHQTDAAKVHAFDLYYDRKY